MKDKQDRVRRAVELFRSEYAPREVRRANAKNWLKAVDRLGDKWLLAHPQATVTVLGAK